MRRVASSLVALASVFLAAGCGSAPAETISSAGVERRLADDDLRMLVTVSPAATGWPWHVEPQTRVGSPPFELDTSDPSYPIQKALTDAYTEAGLVKAATSSWFDSTKKASSFANLVTTSAGAAAALAAEYEFARRWFPEFESQQIRDVDAVDIGEQRWAVRGGGDDAGFVEIGWTRANAFLAVYVSCSPCQSDLIEAARRWAKTIDDAARAAAE